MILFLILYLLFTAQVADGPAVGPDRPAVHATQPSTGWGDAR